MSIIESDIKSLGCKLDSDDWYKDHLELYNLSSGYIIWHASGPLGITIYNPKTQERKQLNIIEKLYIWWKWKRACSAIQFNETKKHNLLIETWNASD